MNDLTIDNFKERTGFRFRISKEQNARIEAGQLTRDQAFQEFLNNGGFDKMKSRRFEIPENVYSDPTLTLDNFSERVHSATGRKHRFRMSREQSARFERGELTREQAFAEMLAQHRTVSVN
jgi:hypothetical protein